MQTQHEAHRPCRGFEKDSFWLLGSLRRLHAAGTAASSRARLYVVYISGLAFASAAGGEEKEEGEDVKEEEKEEENEEEERIGICGSDPSRSKKS